MSRPRSRNRKAVRPQDLPPEVLTKLGIDPAKAKQTRSKYNNQVVEVQGLRFDSKWEARRWLTLQEMQARGEIRELRRQVRFPIRGHRTGLLICTYIADFVYIDAAGKQIIEDAKGKLTDEYKLKKKLMREFLEIEIHEVYARPKRAKAGSDPGQSPQSPG